MDDDDEELEQAGESTVGLSVATVANIVRSEIQRGMAPIEQQLTRMQTFFGDRLGQLEATVSNQGSRIEKLEQAISNTEGTPRSHTSDYSAKVDKQISELFAQVELLRGPSMTNQQDYARTMVVGGLKRLTSPQQATSWLSDKLNALSCSPHIGTYMKSQTFQGLLFAKFKNTVERGTAVALLRSAELTEQGNRVWAAQDLPLQWRTRKIFLMNSKWQLAEWGFLKREFEFDDEFTQLKVGHLVVVKISVVGTEMQCAWADTWAQWEELQQGEELKQLLARANASLQKNFAAKGTGKSKQQEWLWAAPRDSSV